MMRLAMILVLAVSGCLPDRQPKPLDSGLKGYDPNLIRQEQAACEKRGGRWGQGGKGGRFVCYTDTRDSGKQCTAKADCEGLCLARSQSCAPVTPLFGCNEVLAGGGLPMTLCID